MMHRMKTSVLFLAAAIATSSFAQSGRTLEELKAETQARADRNAYPLIGLKADEVREALGRLTSMDRDEWAASWSQLGDRYMAKKDFHQAWLYYSFARWPVPNSPGKQKAYEKALEAYLAYAKRFDPPPKPRRDSQACEGARSNYQISCKAVGMQSQHSRACAEAYAIYRQSCP